MQLRDFMTRDHVGCRGMRRNAARLAYRAANGAAAFVNSRQNRPTPARTAKAVPAVENTPAPTAEVIDAAAVAEARERAAKDRKNKAARERRAAAKAKLAEAA